MYKLVKAACEVSFGIPQGQVKERVRVQTHSAEKTSSPKHTQGHRVSECKKINQFSAPQRSPGERSRPSTAYTRQTTPWNASEATRWRTTQTHGWEMSLRMGNLRTYICETPSWSTFTLPAAELSPDNLLITQLNVHFTFDNGE